MFVELEQLLHLSRDTTTCTHCSLHTMYRCTASHRRQQLARGHDCPLTTSLPQLAKCLVINVVISTGYQPYCTVYTRRTPASGEPLPNTSSSSKLKPAEKSINRMVGRGSLTCCFRAIVVAWHMASLHHDGSDSRAPFFRGHNLRTIGQSSRIITALRISWIQSLRRGAVQSYTPTRGQRKKGLQL